MIGATTGFLALANAEEGACQIADDENQLYNLTAQGWILVAIIQGTAIIDADREELDPENSYACGGKMSLKTPVVVTSTRYLLRASKNKTVKDLQKNCDDTAGKLFQAESKLRESDSEARKLEETLKLAVADRDRFSRDLGQEIKENGYLLKTKSKMENHLGKLRLALGEIRMNEIIEEEK